MTAIVPVADLMKSNDVALVWAIAAREKDVQAACQSTHAQLVSLTGAYRRGPVSWREVPGRQALAVLEDIETMQIARLAEGTSGAWRIDDAGTVTDSEASEPEVVEAFRSAREFLSAHRETAVLVIATCPAVPYLR